VDEAGFFSRHAALDAVSDGTLEPDRATVVKLGVDHLSDAAADIPPADPLGGRPYAFVLGNAYWHKNRLFALRLLAWLVERHGWDGGLVLAGGDPVAGSSSQAENAFIRVTASLDGRVASFGHLSHAEQRALYRGADLVLFPSLYEGFGFIPFEAAKLGKACAYSHLASMRELLPPEGALPSFDLDEAGPFVLELLQSENARRRVVDAVNDAAAELTWDRTAAGYLEVYGRAVEREARGASRLMLGAVPGSRPPMTEMEALVLEVYRRRPMFRAAVNAAVRSGAVGLRAARHLRRRRS
jgi:glycosyltransferase involved in cell wall biosynthesis